MWAGTTPLSTKGSPSLRPAGRRCSTIHPSSTSRTPFWHFRCYRQQRCLCSWFYHGDQSRLFLTDLLDNIAGDGPVGGGGTSGCAGVSGPASAVRGPLAGGSETCTHFFAVPGSEQECLAGRSSASPVLAEIMQASSSRLLQLLQEKRKSS